MMDLLCSLRKSGFSIGFFNNIKTHNGNKEIMPSSSQGYSKLATSEEEGLVLNELQPPSPAQSDDEAEDKFDDVIASSSVAVPGSPCSKCCDMDEYSFTDDEDDRTCLVCDMTFVSRRQLRYHQKKERHYGCSVCDDVFPSRILLEYHKENCDHWTYSDDEDDDERFPNEPDDDVMESDEDEQLLFY